MLESHLDLTLDFDDLPQLLGVPDVLGATSVAQRRVMVDQTLDPTVNPTKLGRYMFTLAHELGHWELHRHLFMANLRQKSLFAERDRSTIVCRTSSRKDPMEWQADAFAGYLLMPKAMVMRAWEGRHGSLEPYFAAPEIADYLAMDHESLGELLQYAFEELQKKSQRLLVVLDGFDHLPLGTGISPNLLDQMRTFAQQPSLRLVTGSRSRLRELCQTEATRTSDFWRIFHDPPLQIGCFDSTDWDVLLAPFAERNIQFEKSGRSELDGRRAGSRIRLARRAVRRHK